ncbi:MAG: hypothetical protein Q9N32_04915 [Gammaproteobacteria bacterium]|nr:hypothetical protein [Gammaproteobacteria bacterium]
MFFSTTFSVALSTGTLSFKCTKNITKTPTAKLKNIGPHGNDFCCLLFRVFFLVAITLSQVLIHPLLLNHFLLPVSLHELMLTVPGLTQDHRQ